ncbi:hypothetical protein BCR33DRAFT_852285 [Rhizoclosmatium globosum]|uniref:Methyltransferase domain-containing protein n=1 Tax=Rhizoclosmatium globosum TaxID=329046 RepID=A0A1Y2C4M2_9FUNG|nr:hypothetical protein BCR33DRAFT_852285 [Rhizoclosmatium globosum]|eukprot:ORY41275.1 hypothetical protein BCR33DRAFT_852285 [Rhizoclosmatium globosum]
MFRKLGAGNVANGGDGGKWSCTEFFQPAPRSCVVVSLGSRGEFDFENSILEYTNNDCTIYTFDCTGTWISPNPNIKLYSWCLGNDEIIEGRIYKTWHSITKELGLTHVDYFKIDIEGYEWVAMPTVLENWELGVLPKQIAIEIHLWSPQPEGVAEPYQIPLTTTVLISCIQRSICSESFTKLDIMWRYRV